MLATSSLKFCLLSYLYLTSPLALRLLLILFMLYNASLHTIFERDERGTQGGEKESIKGRKRSEVREAICQALNLYIFSEIDNQSINL